MHSFQLLTLLSLAVLYDFAPCDNRCSWVTWEAWTACSATCGGGSRYRTRPLCCADNWDFDTCIIECGLDSDDSIEFDECNTVCYHGAVYSSSNCQCGDAYYGSCCENEITCGQPAALTNGGFQGSHFDHGDSIEYYCDEGYVAIDGDVDHTCKRINSYFSVGYWDGQVPHCAYIRSCDSNPCENGAMCTNSYDNYTCTCLSGWTGSHCEIDIQPPVYSNCSRNVTYYSAESKTFVTWSVPQFWDPFGEQVHVTSNYPDSSNLLPWGEHIVQFVGDKPSNGLRAECLFTVSVYAKPCPPLPSPMFGAFACNSWNSHYTEVCVLLCETGHTVPLGVDLNTLYVCGASGNWLPQHVNVSCSELTNEISAENDDHVYQDPCTVETPHPEIQTKYIQLLLQSDFTDLCVAEEWQEECRPDNTQVIC